MAFLASTAADTALNLTASLPLSKARQIKYAPLYSASFSLQSVPICDHTRTPRFFCCSSLFEPRPVIQRDRIIAAVEELGRISVFVAVRVVGARIQKTMGGLWRPSSTAVMLLLCTAWICSVAEGRDPNGSTESLTFYVHCTDEVAIVAGPGKEQPDLDLIDFGSTLVFDNDITEGPSPSSKLIGRRQGVGIKNNHDNTNYYLLFTVIFENHDKYTGTLQVGGTEIGSGDREISVLGGTGDFRGARGYSTFHLYSDDPYPIIMQDFVLYRNSFNYKPYPGYVDM